MIYSGRGSTVSHEPAIGGWVRLRYRRNDLPEEYILAAVEAVAPALLMLE